MAIKVIKYKNFVTVNKYDLDECPTVKWIDKIKIVYYCTLIIEIFLIYSNCKQH